MGISLFNYESGNDQIQPEEFRGLLAAFTEAAEEYYGDWGTRPQLSVIAGNEKPLDNLRSSRDIPDSLIENAGLVYAFVTFAGKHDKELIVLGLEKHDAPKRLRLIWTTPENNGFRTVPDQIRDFANKQGNGSTVKIIPHV